MTRLWLRQSIIKCGMLFMILCTLLNNRTGAQSSILPPGITQQPADKNSPGGVLDTALDYLGNKYSLGQIAISNKIRMRSGETPKLVGESMGFSSKGKPGAPGKTISGGAKHTLAPTIVAPCTPGYFQLYLEAGCGMDDPGNPAEVARLAVMCQVLTDISNFIPSPCTASGQKVNIWVQNPGSGGGFLGVATPFFNIPYSTTASGIADNMIWLTINSGTDAWTNVTSPLYSSGSASSFYHGAIAFQFDGSVNWHTDMTTVPLSGEYDLYTVALHEMLHAIGFHTLINYDGTSIFGAGFKYYSRYDQFLQTAAGTPLLAHSGTCGVYDWQFNTALTPFPALSPGWISGACPTGYQTGANVDHTTCATAIKYVDGSMTVPVYSPSCFERGSSLSHFEDECYAPGGFPLSPPASNNQYFVMSEAGRMGLYNSTTNPGAMKRYPQPEVRQALCDIGYMVNTSFGNAVNLNLNTYTGSTCPGLQVAGINDGFASGAYVYYTTGTTPVDVNAGTSGTSILANDYGAASFKCLEVVFGSGTLSATSGTAGTLVSFTPTSGSGGIQLLRYIPVSATGDEGNITYVYVFVGSGGCVPTACDMVSNGDFENVVPGSFGDIASNPGIIHCWDTYCGSADLYSRGCSCGNDIPWTWTTVPTDTHLFSLSPNDHFIDIQTSNNNGGPDWTEGVQGPLTTSLISGQTYVLSFWAKTGHRTGISFFPFFDNHMEVCISPSVGPLAYIGSYVSSLPAGLNLIWDVLMDTQHGDDWHYYTKTFTYSGAPGNRIVIFNAPYLNSWVPSYALVNLIDDISIKPASAVVTFTPPTTMCSSAPLFDLSTVVSIPGGTFSWQTVSSGVVVTSNSNWFDPSAAYNASIMSGGTGVVTVCYEYTDILGCTQNVCAEITIISGVFTPILGTLHVCVGATTTLTDAAPGGTWTSSNTLIATINPSTGLVTSVAPGTTIISYTTPCGPATATFTVNPLPVIYTITGGGSYCIVGTGVHIGLSGSSIGVNYQLYLGITPVGSPMAGTGIALDFGLITTVGAYTIVATDATTGCTSTMSGSVSVTYYPLPTKYKVSGGGNMCVGDPGLHIYLNSSSLGVNYQLYCSGTPVGVPMAGTGTTLDFGLQTSGCVYTVIATDVASGCTEVMLGSATITVYPLPGPITGPAVICVGASAYLSDAVPGGTWSSSNTTVATINPSTGLVFGVSVGTSVITYTSPGGCYVTRVIAVGTVPITGPTTVCVGATITLSDGSIGGTWSSANTFIATVDPVTGVVTGVSIGVVTISYTTDCGIVTIKITVIDPAAHCVCTYAAAGVPFSELGATGIIPAGFYSGNYYINHNVTVSGTVSLFNCVVVVAPGVTVTVSSGSMLSLISSHLFSCYPDMWQGIVLSTAIIGGGTGPTGQLQIISNSVTSLIEDAMVAVDIPSPTAMPGYTPGLSSWLTMLSAGCTFNKNMIGVRISGYNVPMPITTPTDLNPSYPFVIENSVFTCRDFYGYTDPLSGGSWPFVWPSTFGIPGALKLSVPVTTPYQPPYLLNTGYTQTVCNNGLLSQYGIDLEKVGFETGAVGSEIYSTVAIGGASPAGPQDLNLFDNMNYGIYAHNSNLLTRNSGFMNMYATPMGGDGIYAWSDNFGLYQLYVYGDWSGSYNNTFWNNVNCVEASEMYNVIGVHANMSSEHVSTNLADPQGKYGYKLSSSHYFQEQTNYNTIYNIGTGISINTPLPALGGTQYIGQSTVDYNVISAVNPFGAMPIHSEYMQQAVGIQNLVAPVGGGIFLGSQQNVDHNTIGGVYNGISVVNSNTANATQYITTDYNYIRLAVDPTLPLGSPNQTGITHRRTLWDYINDNMIVGPGYNVPAPPSASSNTYYYSPMLEGIHVVNVATTNLHIGCNLVDECNTGFYFGGHNTGIMWWNNVMRNNSYGFALDGDIGTQGNAVLTTGNQWLTSGGTFSWTGINWQTYTIGLTDAANSLMFVNNSVAAENPTNNSGESALIYNWTTSYGIDHTTSHPSNTCMFPVVSSVPVAMRPGGGSGSTEIVHNTTKITGDLAVIPNPNSGVFTLKGNVPEMASSAQVTLDVMDVLGRTLYHEVSVIEHGVIDKRVVMGDNIASGVYFIKITDNETSKTLRFTLTR